MKIYEIDSTGTDLALYLRNLIAKYNHANQPARLSWDELNAGLPSNDVKLNYSSFTNLYGEDPDLWRNLLSNFDSDGVDLNTNAKPATAQQTDKDKARQKIKNMAKSALNKRFR